MNGHAFSDHAAGNMIHGSIGLPSGKEHTVYAKRTEKIPGGKDPGKTGVDQCVKYPHGIRTT